MDANVVWAAEVLRAQRMPAAEIGAVLEADEEQEIRRRLELHGERLQERLVDELRTLARVERLLTEALGGVPAAERPAFSQAGNRYRAFFHPTWGRLFDNLAPAPGNHEYDNDPSSRPRGLLPVLRRGREGPPCARASP